MLFSRIAEGVSEKPAIEDPSKIEGELCMKSNQAQVMSSHVSSMRKQRGQFLAVLASCAVVLTTVGTVHAAFPGRNGRIAFQSQTSAGLQIFTVRPSGRDLRQITFLGGDARAADWSPDGRLIAFEHDAPGECGNVAIMNADGSGLIEFPDPTVCQGDPSFTPDGSRIVFGRFDPATNDEAHWSMDLNGNDRHRIGTCCADPTVSPNGRRLSFVSFNGQPAGAALFTSNLEGRKLVQVTPFEFDVAVKQDWSPDGRHLVFTQYRGRSHSWGIGKHRNDSPRWNVSASADELPGRRRQGIRWFLLSKWALDRLSP